MTLQVYRISVPFRPTTPPHSHEHIIADGGPQSQVPKSLVRAFIRIEPNASLLTRGLTGVRMPVPARPPRWRRSALNRFLVNPHWRVVVIIACDSFVRVMYVMVTDTARFAMRNDLMDRARCCAKSKLEFA